VTYFDAVGNGRILLFNDLEGPLNHFILSQLLHQLTLISQSLFNINLELLIIRDDLVGELSRP
jgi:hypothetical protein